MQKIFNHVKTLVNYSSELIALFWCVSKLSLLSGVSELITPFEPLIVIKPLTKNPLLSSETLPSTGLCQTGTSTTPNSPIRSALHSLIQSLPHTPARSSLLARHSTPVHLITSSKKLTFSHPTSHVIISLLELTSDLSNLKQKYSSFRLAESLHTEKHKVLNDKIHLKKNESLHKEIAQLRRRISDLEAENKQAKEEIKALVIINEGIGKKSDLQSKTAGSTILERKKSEREGELSDDNDGKSSSEIQPSQLSTERSFDLKAAWVMLT
ncbi:hypothetical protein F8M41_006482 [Gigaspora margarita]|uniref:Uncharacterized protein n=1 Tax=Gigaspora margarita TaxID=4874 RepID=A0A8H4A439_GIGMA|nr:hypothetical protein F8M41_006482 [Gigaspora margarita]